MSLEVSRQNSFIENKKGKPLLKLPLTLLILLTQLPIFAETKNADWESYSLRSGSRPSFNNKVSLYQNGSAQEPLKKLISQAQKFLFIHLLSIECDQATEPFIQQIEKKAQDGTEVFLIINKMYSLLSLSCVSRLEQSGVQVHRAKTHASYWVNDQAQLLIGSQSLARMFLLADGRNNLDRDVMAYAEGDITADAILDFIEVWGKPVPQIKDSALQVHAVAKKNSPDDKPCYFLSENNELGLKSWSNALLYWIPRSQKNIFFSGVKIETERNNLSDEIKNLLVASAEKGIPVTYLGNGPDGGNGELTMVLDEYIQSQHFLSPLFKWLRNWDNKNRLKKHFSEYSKWSPQSKVKINMYDQFVHYKVWNFDDEALIVGSANLDNDAFEKLHEAALFCRDEKLVQEWKKAQDLDLQNSEPF